MNLSEKQKAPVLKNSVKSSVKNPVKNAVKKSNGPSLDWLETLGRQHIALQASTQQAGGLTGGLLPRWFCLLESDPDENNHFIKGYN